VLIFLTGFMGSGKTTTGRMLAGQLNYDFADLDVLIEKCEGVPITEIFAQKGEDYFRLTESAMLESLLEKKNLVVALGGGTACFHDNMKKMKSAGITVYLKLSPEKLAFRLSRAHQSRPLVAGKQGEELINHIRKLLAGREGWYRQADVIYNADNFNLAKLTAQITPFLERSD
jgi:shikimate kinase